MHLHINHMYCTRPCWGGEAYLCRYLVAINRIGKDKSYYDTPEEDWTNLTEGGWFFNEEEYERYSEFESLKDLSEEELKKWAMKPYPHLKPEVIDWLNENIKDRRDKEHPKGWCIGDASYLSTNSLSISIFFERKKDAMAFIERWSVYKKPFTYFDYFREISKELDVKTGEYFKAGRFVNN